MHIATGSPCILLQNCLKTFVTSGSYICPTYKEFFQVRWDNSIPLFLHAAIYRVTQKRELLKKPNKNWRNATKKFIDKNWTITTCLL